MMAQYKKEEETKTAKFQKNKTKPSDLFENKNAAHQAELAIVATAQRKENKTGIPDQLKQGVENLSGISMDDVKVHYNSPKPAQLNAHAYAQGNQIHLGSGQEKHLAHEAWHVVQQKQGRVKPTTKFNGASINDNAGLEKEADVMGSKATQLKQREETKGEYKSLGNESSPIQRMKVENNSKVGVTAISDNKGLIAPLKTPNHELFFSDDRYLAEMNNRGGTAGNSVIKFKKGPTKDVGGTSYNLALVEDTSLSESKLKEIKASLKSYRSEQLEETETLLNEKYSDSQVRKNIQRAVSSVEEGVETIKKLITLEAATAGADHISSVTAYVFSLEELLANEGAKAGNFATIAESMRFHLSFDEKLSKLSLFTPLLYLISSVKSLGDYDAETVIDMGLLRKANYLEENIAALEKVDEASNEAVMLYRSCDTVASLLLGNKINLDSSQILSKFGEGDTFHFATRIVTDGKDWVTMEGYAIGSEIASKIIGDESGSRFFETLRNRMENSWQFIMYGSISKDGESHVDSKNRFFEEYTRFRMFLKGNKVKGETSDFHKNYRIKALNVLSYIHGVRFEAKDLKPLIDLGLVDKEGYIITNAYFEKSVDELAYLVSKHKGWVTPTLKEHVRYMIENSQKMGKIAMPQDSVVYSDRSNYIAHLQGIIATSFESDDDFFKFYDESWAITENKTLSNDEKHQKQLELFRKYF